MTSRTRLSRVIWKIEMKQQIDKLMASIRSTRARPAPADPAMAIVMAASGIDGPGLAQQQIAALVRWSTDPTLTEDDRSYAATQLVALELRLLQRQFLLAPKG